MALLSHAVAVASGVCSDCRRRYQTLVKVAEGENQAYVRCGGCGHINNADEFESRKHT